LPTAPAGSGWIVFRNADFGDSERGRGFTATVARSLPGEAVLKVWHAKPGSDRPDDGRKIGQLAVPGTGGKYRRAEVTAPLEPAAGPGDLYPVLCSA
jgi:hypothetical protein